MSRVTVSLTEIEEKTAQALIAHGADQWIAESVAQAVRKAEEIGNLVCGLYYLESYCTQLETGRVDGVVEPVVTRPRTGAVQVDAKFGFAQPAFARGVPEAVEAARTNGTCSLAVCHSHTCTSMGYFTEQIAEAGLVGIGMTNAPACVSPPGGTQAVLGTNPVAMSVPARSGGVAFQFDQSTSAIAIGKIRIAAADGTGIPFGWAVDKAGNPTDDPNAALEGSLLSAGGYKGYGFGLMAEVFASVVTGSVSSVDAPPLKSPHGPAHDLGQFYFLLDPVVFSGDAFWSRLEALVGAVQGQQNARLPGTRRESRTHVAIDAGLWSRVNELASS